MNLYLTTVHKAFTGRLALITFAVAFLYLLLPGAILNRDLLIRSLLSSSSLGYKLTLTYQILLGYIEMPEGIELFFLFLTAILLGMNVALLVDSISHLRQSKSLTFSVGGAALIGLSASGCASCGVSLLSVLGISSSVLAVHNLELYIFSSVLLILSLVITTRTHSKVCKLH